ncbi:hypothetical protein [Paenibacillus ginsengarvi]|uniref:DUF1002 domain-containing protein n=1 Tax=Paenibacillus ginsengarvi TaxID=400777 RepID=A0A3B0C557_9BACL|nr:hypothetical protein [Paenibacillus ginsengarvi]RKN80722.1 hypothetical protein D7M11_19815 [Paenibacillus ginsengarvi]
MMKNKLFSKIALSTALLSAIASPSVFAENAGSQASVSTAPAALHVAVSSVAITDPVKLAEKYAPETVSDWKQTLEQYREAMSDKFGLPADGEGMASIKSVTLSRAAQAADADEAGMVSFKLESVSGEAVTLTPAQTITLDTAEAPIGTVSLTPFEIKDGVTAGVTVMSIPGIATATAVSISGEAKPLTNAFLDGWKALDEAARSEDGAAIKQALAHQLDLYKQEIASLKADPSQASGGLALYNIQTVPAETAEPQQ